LRRRCGSALKLLCGYQLRDETAPLRGDLQPQTRHDTASLAQFSNAFGAAA
jgi:hypothetical protein